MFRARGGAEIIGPWSEWPPRDNRRKKGPVGKAAALLGAAAAIFAFYAHYNVPIF